MSDLKKLKETHKNFTDEMMTRLHGKKKQGYSGWDYGDFNTYGIPRRMNDKMLNVLIAQEKSNPMDLVDIANFAMFLHHKLTTKEDTVGE